MQLRNTFRHYIRLWRYHFRLICIGTALVICVTLIASLCVSPMYLASVALFVGLWAAFLLVIVYHRMSRTGQRESTDERSQADQDTALLASVTLPETPRPHILARELSVGLEGFVETDTPSEVAQMQPPVGASQSLLIMPPFLEKETNVPGGELLPPSSFKKGLDLPGLVQRSRRSGLLQYLNSDWQLE